MKYISTRGGIKPISFTKAVMMGLATDGGLILPERTPDVSDRLDRWRNLSFPDLAFEIISLFVGTDIPSRDLNNLIQNSYSTFTHPEIVPVVSVDDFYLMELFHGPTLAFKDIALQFLGNLFEYILKNENRELNILGATSGDTGSAAIYGVRGKENINIFILHPHQKVSPIQERQMTTVLDENVFNIAIQGTFDDGQRIIKSLFTDLKFKNDFSLGAVNSVNWARVMAQIVYYFYGAFRVSDRTNEPKVQVCVPTGNFGNIFAGYLAKKMGAPVSKLILASNDNDILPRFFESGVYRKGLVKETLSPSMDIQIASNFERLLYYYVGEEPKLLSSTMATFSKTGSISVPLNERGYIDEIFLSGRGNTLETLEVIKNLYQRFGYLIDPHSAVGVAVAQKSHEVSDPILCLATAHPAKFPVAIEQALGQDVTDHKSIKELHKLPSRCTVLPASENSIRQFIKDKLS